MTTTTPIQSGAANALVQQLFKKADTNGDGRVSANEFQSFLTTAMQTPDERSAFVALARNVASTTDNLRQIAGQLGPERSGRSAPTARRTRWPTAPAPSASAIWARGPRGSSRRRLARPADAFPDQLRNQP